MWRFVVVAYGAAWFVHVVRCGKNTTARPRDVHAPARRRRVAHAARAHCACAARSRIYAHRPHRTHHNHARSLRTLHDGSSRDRCPLRAGSRTAHSAEKPRGAERNREKPRCCVDQPASTALSPSRCVSRLTLHAIPCARHARTHTHTHPSRALPPPPRSHRATRQLGHPTYSAIHPTYHQTHPSHILAPDSPCARPHPRTALAACSTPEWSHHPPSPLPVRAHLAARRSCSPASIAEIAGDARESARRSERSFLPSL